MDIEKLRVTTFSSPKTSEISLKRLFILTSKVSAWKVWIKYTNKHLLQIPNEKKLTTYLIIGK